MNTVIPITSAAREIISPDWLARAETVHRQLRPHLPMDYAQRMREVFASGGEMVVATDGASVLGIAVFRVLEKTFSGRELYCDDLVTDQQQRSKGVGKALMEHLERVGCERGCDTLALDSGCQRGQAHKFYFREGLTIPAFHFSRPLK